MMVFSHRCNATYIAHRKNFACEFTGKFKVGFFRGTDFFHIHEGNFLFCPCLKISNRPDFYFQNSPGLMDRKTAFSIFFHKRTYGYSRSHVFKSEKVILDFSDMRTYTLLRNFVLSDFENGLIFCSARRCELRKFFRRPGGAYHKVIQCGKLDFQFCTVCALTRCVATLTA